jgi:hypothetical protein
MAQQQSFAAASIRVISGDEISEAREPVATTLTPNGRHDQFCP